MLCPECGVVTGTGPLDTRRVAWAGSTGNRLSWLRLAMAWCGLRSSKAEGEYEAEGHLSDMGGEQIEAVVRRIEPRLSKETKERERQIWP